MVVFFPLLPIVLGGMWLMGAFKDKSETTDEDAGRKEWIPPSKEELDRLERQELEEKCCRAARKSKIEADEAAFKALPIEEQHRIKREELEEDRYKALELTINDLEEKIISMQHDQYETQCTSEKILEHLKENL